MRAVLRRAWNGLPQTSHSLSISANSPFAEVGQSYSSRIRRIVPEITLDAGEDRGAGLDRGGDFGLLGLEQGDVLGMAPVYPGGGAPEIALGSVGNFLDTIIEADVVVALDLLAENPLQLAGMQGFERVQFGSAFDAPALHESGRPLPPRGSGTLAHRDPPAGVFDNGNF